jgi:ketosteroid isomerase-like protein
MVSVYNAYWNKQDSAGVASLFAPDAIVSDDNRNFLNTADILNKWIHPNIRMVRNLKTTKIQEWSAKDRAGYTGFYEIDLIMHDSIIARPKGVVTFNFIKNKNGWQITTAHLHSFFTRK